LETELKVKDLRTKITQLQASIEDLKSASLPPAEIAAAVKRFLDEEADRKTLYDFNDLTRPGGPAIFLSLDPERFLLHLFRDEIEQRLTQHLESQNPNPGLSTAAREKKIAAMTSQIDELSRQEEILILQAEDAGEFVERRKDADGVLIADIWAELLADDGRLKDAA
jgi:hypothetical protein